MSKKKGETMDEQKVEAINESKNGGRAATATELLALAAVKFKNVELPELGEGIYVRVRNMSAQHANVFFDTTPEKRAAMLPGILAQCAVNEDGTRMFTDEQAHELEDMNLGAFMKLCNGLLEVSGVSGKGESPKAA